jgi:hypothetical protein
MARNAAGLTQSKAGSALECGQAKINKMERSLVEVDDGEIDKLIELYKVTDEPASEIRDLATRIRSLPKRPRFPEAWQAYGELSDEEPEASEIRCWHSERIPVPLQSERYRLALCGARTQTEVTDVLSGLRARSQIFSNQEGPRYRAVLSESSLRRMPGGSSDLVVDVAQHLLRLTEKYATRLELRILAFNANVPYVDSDFVILRFTDDDLTDYTYLEHPGGARTFRKAKELTHFHDHWEMLRKAALDGPSTRSLLTDLAMGTAVRNDQAGN